VDNLLTTAQIATTLGRTDSRVRQLIRGETTIMALPADLDTVCGQGRYTTTAVSFTAWLGLWVDYRGPWQQDRLEFRIGN